MEKDLTFRSPLSYEECCNRLQTLPDWEWVRGDSDILGSHIRGHHGNDDSVELYYLEQFYLELFSPTLEGLQLLQTNILALLEAQD